MSLDVAKLVLNEVHFAVAVTATVFALRSLVGMYTSIIVMRRK